MTAGEVFGEISKATSMEAQVLFIYVCFFDISKQHKIRKRAVLDSCINIISYRRTFVKKHLPFLLPNFEHFALFLLLLLFKSTQLRTFESKIGRNFDSLSLAKFKVTHKNRKYVLADSPRFAWHFCTCKHQYIITKYIFCQYISRKNMDIFSFFREKVILHHNSSEFCLFLGIVSNQNTSCKIPPLFSF